MKITEKQMKEFFPSNMRFLHYVAKRNGYTFYNDEAVRKANYHASVALTKIYNEGKEFDSIEHLYGYVMQSFKYAILSSYHVAKKDSLNIRTESELLYGDSDDEYNVYLNSAVANIREYDNTYEEVYERLSKELSPLDRQVLHFRFKEDLRPTEIQSRMEVTDRKYWSSIHRIRTKYNRITKELRNEGDEFKQENANTYQSAERFKLRIQKIVRDKPNESNEADELRYSKTMSWLHPDV